MIHSARSALKAPVFALTVALLAVLVTPVNAEGLSTPSVARENGATVVAAAPRPLTAQLEEAQAQLAQAQHLRDELNGPRNDKRLESPDADKLRLVDWLIDLHKEKVKRLEALAALQNAQNPSVSDDPLVKALAGPPPYSALQVDALRDEIEGLKENLAAAEASIRANQTEMQNLQDQLKDRDAEVRRAGDQTLTTKSGADVAKSREQQEVADLLKRAAQAELAVLDLDQERLRLRTASMKTGIDQRLAVVASVLPHQRLTPDDLAAERLRADQEKAKLTSEIARIDKRDAQYRAERDSFSDEHQAVDDNSNRQVAFLDLAIKTDDAVLKGLDYLQMLNAVAGDAWEKRYVVLSSTVPEQRRTALAGLNELRTKLADFHNQTRTRQEALRTEIREQRLRIDNLPANNHDQWRETESLNLLLQQDAMDERVELATTHLERELSRWLDDLSNPGDQSMDGRVSWLRDQVLALLTKIWQQELFVTEDVTEIDGRQVSVQHGVTVGKSIGIVGVFVFGYWLLSWLTRFVQRLLVRHLGVSQELASVVRRWSMIMLSVALIILLLNLARIPLSVFAFLGGTLAIGVGFGAQNIIKNFISGLIVLFERKIRVGDIVELGGVTGHVTAVDLRATTVLGFNGVEALIPNANFVENQVVNWTYSNQQIRHELRLGVAYGTDVRQVEALILAVAAEHPKVHDDPAPELFFENFGDSALAVVLVYWVELNDSLAPRRIESDLRYGIYDRLAKAGIGIPFPQRDVHVSFSRPVSARSTREPGIGAVNAK